MTNDEILHALDALKRVASVIAVPIGPIIVAAIDIASEAVEAGDGDPLQKLEELRRILAAGISADWQSKL